MYKENWEDTKARFNAWWNREKIGRPLMKVVAKRNTPIEELEFVEKHSTPEKLYLDVEANIKMYRNYCRTHKFMAESFPNFSMDLGPGSMALYLGSEPVYSWETLWFKECIHNWDEWQDLKFNENSVWWKKHVGILKKAQELAKGDFLVNIPDIIENLDILLVMRGTENLCFDLMDEPDLIKKLVNQIDDLYFKYYNPIHDIVKLEDGSCSFTCFQIWGSGKTAKVQCDFSAMMSPAQFREFALPSLTKQCSMLDNSLYHLDGVDAIKHLDAIMEIKDLDALQWTAGAGQPDGGCEKWYPIYEKVKAAKKSLWIQLYDGEFEDWVNSAEKLVKTFGSDGLYLIFPEMSEEQAEKLISRADEHWG